MIRRKEEADKLQIEKEDRRLLPNVPDPTGRRTNVDRRQEMLGDIRDSDFRKYIASAEAGRRFRVRIPVTLKIGGTTHKGTCEDISSTGMLFTADDGWVPEEGETVQLSFTIQPGDMPEGYEMTVRKLEAKVVRAFKRDGKEACGIQFVYSLAEYHQKTKGRYLIAGSAFLLLCISLVIILMRSESVIYFRFNKYLYLYSIVTATFLLSRYFFAIFYKPVPVDMKYTPGVSIIVPCFNEETWIQRTILGCVNQDYPPEKLQVIVIDDHSTDHSLEKIKEIIDRMADEDKDLDIRNRVMYYQQPKNGGKREALATGLKFAKHELLVFVDSDSFLSPFAIRNVVQPFKDKEMGGVCGRTDVANTYTNGLTKMQAVRYYIAFRVMKAAEGFFDAATCLSGPLSCYRKDLVEKYCDAWIGQRFLGHKATFGDDRSLTNFILRHNRTAYQDTAIVSTIVPKTYHVFLRQQMRWKRSWLRESLIAAGYMWKKEPFMALSFYFGLVVPIAAPIIVIYNLIYIPIMHRVFPFTFIIGMILMSLLMSMAQLFLRKSSTWVFGIWFCLYYEAVLLWQMPVAWFTFWKDTWGTRMTPADVREQKKKEEKRREKEARKHKGEGEEIRTPGTPEVPEDLKSGNREAVSSPKESAPADGNPPEWKKSGEKSAEKDISKTEKAGDDL